jgi:hypothetical protein
MTSQWREKENKKAILIRGIFRVVTAHSLFALVRGTSQLYKGTWYPGIRVVLRKEETHITTYPEPHEDTMGLL